MAECDTKSYISNQKHFQKEETNSASAGKRKASGWTKVRRWKSFNAHKTRNGVNQKSKEDEKGNEKNIGDSTVAGKAFKLRFWRFFQRSKTADERGKTYAKEEKSKRKQMVEEYINTKENFCDEKERLQFEKRLNMMENLWLI